VYGSTVPPADLVVHAAQRAPRAHFPSKRGRYTRKVETALADFVSQFETSFL
jgi:hypothetical protein